MHPTLRFGSFSMSTYWAALTLGLAVAGMWIFHRLLGLGRKPEVVMPGFMLMVAGGFAGAFGASEALTAALVALNGPLARSEGLSIIWAISGGLIAMAIYCRARGLSVRQVFDCIALPLPLGQAIGRLGCLAAGCCYGRPTASWLGMLLPDHDGVWELRYPTQLLSVGANLLILFALLAVERYGRRRMNAPSPRRQRWPFDGFLFLLYVALFSLKRFGIAYLRESGGYPLLGSLSWMHLNALAGLVVAGLLMAWGLARQAKEGSA